jgi:predicted CXXCH cytochrome family protein
MKIMIVAARRTVPTLLLLALARVVAAGEAPEELVPKAPCANQTCHADLAKNKHVHGPIAVGECAACHVWKDNRHDFTLAHDDAKLCTSCHDDVIPDQKKAKKKHTVHEPVGEDCTTCHSPHGGPDRAFLSLPVIQLCEACHDEPVAQAKAETSVSKHSAVLEGKACLTCHKPHESEFGGLLAAASMDVCLTCHDKTIQMGDRVLPNTKQDIAAKKFAHGPVEDKECDACHTAHGSPRAALLSEDYPATFYAPYGQKAYALCFACHEEALARDAQTGDLTEFRNGTLNLHYLHVNKKVKGRTCRACHATHASDQPAQIRTSVPFGRSGWSIPIRFQKTDSGGSCASGCHLPRTYDREKPVDYRAGQESVKEPAAPAGGNAAGE